MQRYCSSHPDYQAKRKPKIECYSCWRLFLESKHTTVEAYASSQPEFDLDRWLRESIDDIINAPLEEKQSKASFQSSFSFIEETTPSEVRPSDIPTPEAVPSKKEEEPVAYTGILI
jgi:hypothetical protein